MTRKRRQGATRGFAIATIAGVPLAILANAATAAEGPSGPVEEMVITGSYIRGTPEDAALPVDVISSQELKERGSPSVLDLVRSMPYVTAIVGETNQFGANQGTIGSANINLRGLGGMRTLVLMNGRRTTYTPAEGPAGVDTNLLPMAAIGRVEVLKDGAAATYGSDAIAGVVNFITRRDLEGFEVKSDYRQIEGDDGDWNAALNWGWVGEQSNVFLSYQRQHRSELKSTDRDWAFPDYLENPTGWSSFSTPGNYFPRDAANANLTPVPVRDANCTQLGGFADLTPTAAGLSPSCRFSFIPFDNLVEKTEQQQAYAEINTQIGDGVELHLEGLWAETLLPDYRTSPGYPPTSGPNGPGAGQFAITTDALGPSKFSNNPGALAALQQAGLSQATIDATNSIRLNAWRPYAWGGVQELTGGNGGQSIRDTFDIARVSGGLKGKVNIPWVEEVDWDVAVTYSTSTFNRAGVDTMITRLQSALNGLGGRNCNNIPFGRPGSTCLAFNPFSNAIERNPALGLTNPGFISANKNSPELINWMIERWDVQQDQDLLVWDTVVSGELPRLELPGGAIGWALGGQYRHINYQTRHNNPLIDANINPCPIPGSTTCTLKTGPFIFLGQFIPQTLDESVYALFGELAIPVLDNLEFQFAIRYEDYGGLTGDTTNPKLSVRWQALDWLAFRGSVGSTFRGPTPVNKSLQATGLQPIPAAGFQYKSIDFSGNPNLKPETADTYSIGVVIEWEGIRAIVDYWNYQFEDQITSVPFAAVSNAVGNGPGTGAQFANCGHPLRRLVIFDNNDTCTQGVTTAVQMQRIKADVVNGSPVEIGGVDLSLSYDFGEMVEGLSLGIDATYIDKYDQDAFVFGGVPIFGAYDAVGFGNFERFPGTVSEWRALGNINYAWEEFNFRYEARYVDGVTDERPPLSVRDSTGALVPITFGKKVDSFTSHNFYVNWQAPFEIEVTFAATNLLDEDPSEVRHQLSYDPYIGDPIGRTFKIGVRKVFSF